ncbi:MAG: response regulator, partial [Thermoanaerobaculia bacterium]|nr:response regulator [Thermoanaerobaculia bacterium]
MTAGRLVIVEDDPELRDQLCWSLKKDFEVASAPDAVAGSALCATDPDLYLLDMRLPPSHRVEEGLRLLEEIRGRDPDATVVMMSGEGERSAA